MLSKHQESRKEFRNRNPHSKLPFHCYLKPFPFIETLLQLLGRFTSSEDYVRHCSFRFLVAGPILKGTTVFGNANGTAGTSLSELSAPWGITVYTNNSMLIAELGNLRVLHVSANAGSGEVVASGDPYLVPRKAIFDGSRLNLFVIESSFCRIRRYYNGSLAKTIVFGSTCGTDLTQFQDGASFYMDSLDNFYIADNTNHRIMRWEANSNTGVLLAGSTGVLGSDLQHLYNPQDITLDEARGLMYVADTFNDRIVQYSVGSPNGTIVAGGNGPGVAHK